MVDFIRVSKRPRKGSKGVLEVYPKFIIKKSSDLMIRGGDFYAIWLEDVGLWSTDEQDVVDLIDREISRYCDENEEEDYKLVPAFMSDGETRIIDSWHHYCQGQLRDNFHQLDENLIFSNTPVTKESYASKKLSYPLEKGTINSYDKLLSVLYSETERHKIEWCIGSIVSGESKSLQKFAVFYGSMGTGKSTIINIIEQLFEGYCAVFDAKRLGSANANFALESFSSNPLVAIQHDGDLSRIEDNTRLNSLVSHEKMTVDEKFKSTYASRFKCFLFMGTNKPVKITDAKSGILRRLIDISPTGNKVPRKEYERLVEQIKFELGGIAYHCMEVFLEDPGYYDDYQPISMMGATNDFYNFIEDSYPIFKKNDQTTLKSAWNMYKEYCEEAKVSYPLSQRAFKEELRNYFKEFLDRGTLDDGTAVRSLYLGFKDGSFNSEIKKNPSEEISENFLDFKEQESIFDELCKDCPAQYGTSNETPSFSWDGVKTTLKALDTHKLHYVRLPEVHIVADFDLKKDGEKSLDENIKAASKWPKTYAELSKSGKGIHLHYIYTGGDPSKLSRVYSDGIEIKVFTGKSSLRRRLTKCNNEPIAEISSGLPLKGDKKVVNFDALISENSIRTMIKRNLNKEYHAYTAPSIDFIAKILEDAYNSGMHYDVSDMRNAVLMFAMKSTHQADKCMTKVTHMKFKSDEPSQSIETVELDEAPIVFYDIEVFPNLLLICWKYQGKDKNVVTMINPDPEEVKKLMKYRLIGFNCRRYDNHIIYGRSIDYSIRDCYELSQKIIGNKPNCFFGEAYNVSYTDIYDFASKKQSLKKWEIELGIHHLELGLPWDQPVPEELWQKVAEYCKNDVVSTEAVFDARQGDWAARQILAKLAGGSVNDTTNQLSTKLMFGSDRNPQQQFNYRFMGDMTNAESYTRVEYAGRHKLSYPEYCLFDYLKGKYACIFPGYEFKNGKSTYRGFEVGEGGFVYSEPGMYTWIGLDDIASMHPSTIIAEKLFGDLYTKRFEDIKNARIAIKHKDYATAKTMLDGVLEDYILELESGDCWFTNADLAQALKIVINSIYGLTAAKFDNKFRDRRNIDNIVAKRGALFMVNLLKEVQAKGFAVAHIKTDSIKIPNATLEIIDFVTEYGRLYGYEFEHEATYERMCLVNKAVYICKHDGKWDATGDEFMIPYVFKKLFSHEEIDFHDLCETKSVTDALYLDMNENLPDDTDLQKRKKKLEKKLKDMNTASLLDTEALEYEAIIKELEDLEKDISKCHDYHFVGKVGNFCPIKSGVGAGELVRRSVLKGVTSYPSAEGCKGYRWMESEMVKNLGLEDQIDYSYWNKLVDDAVADISQYGDFEWFTEGDINEAEKHILPF